MKVVIIILSLLVIKKSTSFQFPEIKRRQYHVPIVNVRGVNQSILYYKDNGNDELINSILTDLFINQPVFLVSGEHIRLRAAELYNKEPNIILLTDALNIRDFNTTPFKALLFSYWSLLHLVITTKNEQYTCDNGKFNENAISETKTYLNELWQVFRVVRVIVSFPYTCPKQYIIYDGKEWSNKTVYNRSIRVIRPKSYEKLATAVADSGDPRDLTVNYPLRINMFHRFPTSITKCDVVDRYTNMNLNQFKKFCGLDGLLMTDFVRHFKYNISIPNDKDCDKYGFVDIEQNNTTTGSLGCVLREKIDISFNSRFLWRYTTEHYFYLHYVSQDSLCVLLKRSDSIPLWHYATNLFSPFIWAVLLTHLSFLGIATWLLAKISYIFSDEKPLRLRSYLYNSMHATLFGVLLKNDGRFLILKGTSLLCSIILLAMYQGNVNYQFTTRSHYRDIKTLEQLYESSTTLYTSPSIMELLRSALDKNNANQAAFVKRIQIEDTTDTGFVIDHPHTATLARKQDVMIQILKNHTDKRGMPLIYVVDECFDTYYLSFIARNGFPFNEESLMFMMRMLEAGLPNQYYIWTRRTFNLADNYPGAGPEPRPFKNIRLKKLRTAFGLLLVGYLISGFVFIVEKFKGVN